MQMIDLTKFFTKFIDIGFLVLFRAVCLFLFFGIISKFGLMSTDSYGMVVLFIIFFEGVHAKQLYDDYERINSLDGNKEDYIEVGNIRYRM